MQKPAATVRKFRCAVYTRKSSKEGRVHVVYKTDRLSRTPMYFVWLVDVFDRNNLTVVSVTGLFNTTTIMGQLTLNILLSFAQSDREVIGDRVRDKFATPRKRDMWMGGFGPLGYEVKDRKRLVNEARAMTARMFFQRFTKVG